jgi:hypothetical protein
MWARTNSRAAPQGEADRDKLRQPGNHLSIIRGEGRGETSF